MSVYINRKIIIIIGAKRMILYTSLIIGLLAYLLDIRLQIVAFDIKNFPLVNEMMILALFFTILLVMLSAHYISFSKGGIQWDGTFKKKFIPSTEIISYKFSSVRGGVLCEIKMKDGKYFSFPFKNLNREEVVKILDGYILQNSYAPESQL